MSVFVAILGLGLLIFVHECGHFFASLALRMRGASRQHHAGQRGL
jgi:membrane-associated protease RseP (regulator of RpoE activity)